ncbi:hypothetical protein RN001_010286 [Aquatica leii]|uniref:Uncharacterized protein n=1 Tax=Aquatica leii TaxID=1421715 RepID=A0AAN7P0P8_9COLE|nr:hypothetical protein RN001_010286 [Aquatica leii]
MINNYSKIYISITNKLRCDKVYKNDAPTHTDSVKPVLLCPIDKTAYIRNELFKNYFLCFQILASNFPICKLNPKELPECFAKAVEDTLKILKNPVPELGLPSIDPIEVESLQFQGGSGNIVLNQNLKNVKIFNMPSTKVTKAEINIEGYEFNNVLHTFVPEMKFTANCELIGKILLLPIRGNGNLDLNIYNLTAVISMRGGQVEKKKITYLKIDNTTCALTPGLVKIRFDNLFNGEKTLGDNMNKVLNDNWKEVFSEFKAAYEEVLAQYVHNLAGQVFNKVPLKDLFPGP